MDASPYAGAPAPRWTDRLDSGRSQARSWSRPLLVDVLEAVWSVLVSGVAVGIGFALVGGAQVEGLVPLLGIVVGVLLLDTVVNPLLRRLASLGSLILAMILGLVGQLVVLTLVIWLAPGVSTTGWPATVLVVVIAGAVMAVGRWLMGAADSGYVVGQALRGARSTRAGTRPRGLLVVQLDGVSHSVVRRAVESGQVPHLARWIVGGSHTMTTWWATIPSTTPASMAGFLHGDDRHVPAFRWWDRAQGRLMASSRPADSALVESRFEAGQGLLRDGGAAVSTTYSGEAQTSLLVISKAIRARGLGSGRFYVSFFAYPFLLPATLVLTAGEMVKELYQARRQRIRDVRPRVARRGAYIVLRGITNVLLRKLNLSLVVGQMTEGRPIIFVDLVDYDEIAHHAGPERPEAMRSLEGLDGILGHLRHAAQVVETDYELVVLSDHGQSLGDTFDQLHGRSLTDQVRLLMDDASVSAVQLARGEEFGPLNTLITSVMSGATSKPERFVLGPDRHVEDVGGSDGSALPDIAVIGSGNLGMVWFPQLAERATLDVIGARWPGLVPGLALTDGVGAVMVHDGDGHPVVFGPRGVHRLATSEVEGEDPLEGYGSRAPHDLRRVAGLPDCGDLVLLSTVDQHGYIHAFEGQVGSHGGIGGPQNEALLVHPASWGLDADLLSDVDGRQLLVGPVAVHRQLLRWRRAYGAGPRDDVAVQAAR